MKRLGLAWPLLAGDAAADALVYVTLGWLAASTGDLSAGVVLAANTTPAIALMLLGGAVSDRFGSARVATWTTTLRAATLVGFAAMVATGNVSALPLIAMALALGIIDAVHQPAVYSVVAILSERGKQRSSQGLVVGVTRTVGVTGTVLGGMLIGASVALPLWVAAACLLIAAVCAARVPRPRSPKDDEPQRSLWDLTREGLAAVREDPAIVGVMALFTVGNFAATAPLALGIPFLAEAHSWTSAGYGLVYAGFGLGQIAGGSTLAALSRSGIVDETRLGLSSAALCLLPAAAALVALSRSGEVLWAATSIALVGAFLAPGAAILMGYVRERTPDELQGRMNGLLSLSITSSIPLGMIAFGLLVQVSNVESAIFVCGAALALGAVTALALSRRSSDQPAVHSPQRAKK